jgi:hypothetical protein
MFVDFSIIELLLSWAERVETCDKLLFNKTRVVPSKKFGCIYSKYLLLKAQRGVTSEDEYVYSIYDLSSYRISHA